MKIQTVVKPLPGGRVKVESYAVEPALHRWRRLAVALAAILLWGPPTVWTALVIRWDAGRAREVLLARFDAETARAEASCWRRATAWTQKPAGGRIGLEAWVRRCVAELAAE